jgi:hypothetical protein
VFLLTAHWTTGRDDEVMAPSYGLLDRTAYGRSGTITRFLKPGTLS